MLNYKVYNYILNSKKLSKVCINQFKQGNAVTDHIKLYLMRCVIYHSVFHIVLILHLCDSFVPYFYGNKFHSKKKNLYLGHSSQWCHFGQIHMGICKKGLEKGSFRSVLKAFHWVNLGKYVHFAHYIVHHSKFEYLYFCCGLGTVSTVGIYCLAIT